MKLSGLENHGEELNTSTPTPPQDWEKEFEKLVEEVTDYGFNDEYGYYNDWADGVRPILNSFITSLLDKERERIGTAILCRCHKEGAQCMIHNPPFPFKEGIDFVQTPPQDLERLVDEMFVVGNMKFSGLANNKLTPSNLKSFITSLLHSERERVVKLIKEMPDKFPDIESDMFDMGYKQCKEDILAIINK